MMLKPNRLTDDKRSAILSAVSEYIQSLPPGVERDVASKTAFKKLAGRRPDPATRATAYTAFWETERTCMLMNERIKRSQRRKEVPFRDMAIISMASRKISQILGSFHVEEMLSLGRFGPGATFQCRGEDVSRTRKFQSRDVTGEFNKLARGLLADYPLWATALTDTENRVCPLLEPVLGGRLTSVPKDTKTDRTIIVEPTINSWFQQGIGRMIRRRLRAVAGVDLDDQSINQRLARLGSLTNDIATIDLSSASDLISECVVEEMLYHSPDWYFWLNATRSHRVLDEEGNWVKLEKFSSMGNGFTFDLESLIFYALAWAVTAHSGFNTFWVNTMGDDIILPSGAAELLISVFSDVGFRVNRDKSYWDGPFRESCGKDFYNGRDVRGFYCKKLETNIDVMKLHNRIYGWASRTGNDWKGLRSFLLAEAVGLDRYRVPAHLGDVGFHSDFDECCPPVAGDGWESFLIRTIQPVLSETERSCRFLMLDRLQGSDFQRNTVPLRRDPVGYREKVTISHWYP